MQFKVTKCASENAFKLVGRRPLWFLTLKASMLFCIYIDIYKYKHYIIIHSSKLMQHSIRNVRGKSVFTNYYARFALKVVKNFLWLKFL